MKIKVADFVFEIKNNYSYCEQFMTDYLTDEKPDYSFAIDSDCLKRLQESSLNKYPLHYIEYLEIYRKMCDIIIKSGALMMHGAVIDYKGNGYMFTAPSGTGKTTHIKQWVSLYGDDVTIVNGDKPILRLIDGEWFAYGTPWCGKEHFNTNTKTPLKGIVLLARGEFNSIEEVSSDKFNEHLVKQVYLPKNNPQGVLMSLDAADKLFTSVPLYKLKCTISLDAAKVACERINKTPSA